MTLQYQVQGGERLHQPVAVSGERERTHVSLRVEVVRATGLRDAASLVAQEQPVPLGFAAEVGTNCYAKISLPGLIEKVSLSANTDISNFCLVKFLCNLTGTIHLIKHNCSSYRKGGAQRQ